ncbi:retrovirus-related pol polyprotein from transposon TNT 1-94 [Tanacetum coccineum]
MFRCYSTQHLTIQSYLESAAYMTYRAYATGEKTPKPKTTKKKADSESSPKTKSTQASKGKRITTLAKGDKPAKKKQSATKSKGLTVLSEVSLTEAQQMKIAIERSKIQTHSSHASGSGDGVDTYQGEDDEENDEHDSEDDNDEHDNENDNDNDDEDDDQENVCRETQSDDDGEENQEDDDNVMGGEQEDEEDEELYGDMNLNLDRRDTEMTDAHTNQETKEVHVTLTIEPLVVQQQISFVSSDLVSKFINPTLSILNQTIQSDIPVNVSVSVTTTTPSSDTTIPQPTIPIIQPQQHTHDYNLTNNIY